MTVQLLTSPHPHAAEIASFARVRTPDHGEMLLPAFVYDNGVFVALAPWSFINPASDLTVQAHPPSDNQLSDAFKLFKVTPVDKQDEWNDVCDRIKHHSDSARWNLACPLFSVWRFHPV